MDDLLIATWNHVFMRRASGEIEPILNNQGAPYYGLTWDETYVYVGARYWDISEHDHLIVLDRDLHRVDEYELPTGGMLHQILWHDGWIYLTDTKTDRVLRWRGGKWETVFDLGTGGDVYHINSLWHDGVHFWAIGLHGHVWRDWELWTQFPFEAHNIYVEDESLIVCASNQQAVSVNGQLVNLEGPVSSMQAAGAPWRVYTHGLARGPDAFYIGAAMVEPERFERKKGDSVVVVFDPDWQYREVLRFEDVGGIHDIRVLGADRAHNGIAW